MSFPTYMHYIILGQHCVAIFSNGFVYYEETENINMLTAHPAAFIRQQCSRYIWQVFVSTGRDVW